MTTNIPINRDIIKQWKPYLILDFNYYPPCDQDHDRTNSIYFEPIYNDDQYTNLPIFDNTPLFTINSENNIIILKNRPQKIVDILKSIKLGIYIHSTLLLWSKGKTNEYSHTEDGYIYNLNNNFLCLGAKKLTNPFNDNENMILPEKSEYISIKYYNDIIGHIFYRNRSLIYNKSDAKKIWMKKGVGNQVKFNIVSEDIYQIQKVVTQTNPVLLLELLNKILDDNIKNNKSSIENLNEYISNIPYDSINQLIIYFERLKKYNNIELFNKCLNLLIMLKSVDILFKERRTIRASNYFPSISLKENVQFKRELKQMLNEIAINANLNYPQIEKKIFELVLKYYNK
jgi:hypothetical protein